jgi:hypothetical protein
METFTAAAEAVGEGFGKNKSYRCPRMRKEIDYSADPSAAVSTVLSSLDSSRETPS